MTPSVAFGNRRPDRTVLYHVISRAPSPCSNRKGKEKHKILNKGVRRESFFQRFWDQVLGLCAERCLLEHTSHASTSFLCRLYSDFAYSLFFHRCISISTYLVRRLMRLQRSVWVAESNPRHMNLLSTELSMVDWLLLSFQVFDPGACSAAYYHPAMRME
ncbi:hypothetical protein VTN96DRAFT_2265 [Rasamsonia emersonii]